MASLIAENRRALRRHHYIRQATSHNYWVDFAKGIVDSYFSKFGKDFCLVINHSDTVNDAYVIPYIVMAASLTDNSLDPDGRGWSGTIRNNLLRMGGSSISVSRYFNAYKLLAESTTATEPNDFTSDALAGTVEKLTLPEIKEIINRYNIQYVEATPVKRIQISEDIARPSLISDYVKQLQGFRCQICQRDGFRQKNGNLYAEAHHIIELHKLNSGSYCSDNIIVVCPNCHRMLHYADVSFSLITDLKITGYVNGNPFTFDRNIISESTYQRPV